MSSNATTLISTIKTRVAQVLGATYSEIAYALDLSKNSFKGNFKRYGVLAKGSSETSSVNRYVTIDQTFELILTDSFMNTAMSDSLEQAKGPSLHDLAFDIYRDLVNSKAGSPSFVLLVNNLSISEPETMDGNVVVVKATFNIKYRNAI